MDVLPLDHGGPTDRPYEPLPAAALERSVHGQFAEAARRFAGRTAIREGDLKVSYAELHALSARIAAAAAGLAAAGPVAVLSPHDHRFVAAALGAMGSGRPCIPLDADHPLERNARIARHAGAAGVVSAGALAAQARALFGAELEVLDLETLPAAPAPADPDPDEVAYILYTSGSTGEPKGVFQSHRGVLHDTQELIDASHSNPQDRLAMFYSPATIAGLNIMLTALLSGGALELMSPVKLGAEGVVRELRAGGSTVVNCSPTLFRHVVQALGAGERLDDLRLVVLGGERVGWGDLDVVRRGCRPGTLFGVHLGATECWTLHSRWFVDEAVRATSPSLPVGRRMPDRKVTLVDEAGAPVAEGDTGEVLVSSRYIALGYWRDPELTARAFGVDPDDPSSRTYRTGDLARRRPDGLLEFEGRKDQQIKLRGYRIEPGEVEAALRACPGVRDAALVVRRDPAGAPRALIGYVELEDGVRGLQPRHILSMARRRTPAHMWPASVTVLPRLPWLANFKIDRQRLEALDAERAAATSAPADPATAAMTAAFEAVLEMTGVSPDDSLASLGGDSLQAVNLMLRLEAEFGLKLDRSSFDASRTIAEWAAMAREAEAAADRRAADTRPRWARVPVRLRHAAIRRIIAAREAGERLDPTERPVIVWGAAAHRLLISGRLGLARWAMPQLRAGFPAAGYFASMCELLEAMPPAEGVIPFEDDPEQAVQVVPRPGAEATVIYFAGGGEVGTGVPLPLLHRWIGQLDANLIYLRPFGLDFYADGMAAFGLGAPAMVAGLRRRLAALGSSRTFCLGNSMGGFAAVRYGLELGAEAILTLGPQTMVGPDFDERGGDRIRERIRRNVPTAPLDLRPIWPPRAPPPRLVIVYGEQCWEDRLYAEHMAGLPGVELRQVDGFDSHTLARELIRRGELLPLLRSVVEAPAKDRRETEARLTAAKAGTQALS